MWDNDDIAEGTEECPDCGSMLDSEGYGSNCGGYHQSNCSTCLGGVCDGSC
jgi:hypothetical protein